MTEIKEFERKLIEMTAGTLENSRFSVCYWHGGAWHMCDRSGSLTETIENVGYNLVAIHDLPERTAIKHETNSGDAAKELEIMKENKQ